MSKTQRVNIGEGIFLRPTEEEADLIWEAVRSEGFEENGEGVLRLLLLLLSGEEDHFSRSPLFRHFKDNPEDLAALKQMGAQAFSGLLGKILRK